MTTNATAVQPEYVSLPLERIRESATNPRQRFNDLDELAASIRAHGLLQPILVRPLRKDFELVVGARRLRAAQLAGLTSIPAQVKALDDRSAREVQIIENLQRQDVHPLEEADGYNALLDSTPSCTIDESLQAKPETIRNADQFSRTITNEPGRAAGRTTHPEFRVALQPSPRRVVPSSGPVTGTDSVAPARKTPPLALRRPH
jgi:ParB/RepB/Spo0J family partition protein